MVNIEKNFDEIEIGTFDSKKGERYFDPVRKMFLCITPEETVRQKMIVYLNKHLGVDYSRMYVEDHLIHYGVDDQNGRIDISILEDEDMPLAVVECKEPKISIEGLQVYEQGIGYADAIGAKYVILVNGRYIQYYKCKENGYVPIEEILTYEQMIGNEGKTIESKEFIRYAMQQYEDIDFLKKQEWYYEIIGEDTDECKVPAIINLDDALWDYSHKLSGMISKNLEVVEDLGVSYMNYNNASGGEFGTGYYRLFLINDRTKNKQFISGVSILATAKTVNDDKYGNREGLTVLTVCRNDGDYDEISVQINLNKFMDVKQGSAQFTHNAAVTRKGASKKDAMTYIESHVPGLIKENMVFLGEIDTTVPLYVDNDDVKSLIGHIVEYSIYRDAYKHSLRS